MRAPALLLLVTLVACGSPAASHTTTSSGPAPRRTQCTVALRFEDDTAGGVDPAIVAIPHTRVTLVRICEPGGTETQVIGSEVGICQYAEPGEALLRARCWWAGEGSELELTRVLRDVVVRRAEIHEDVRGDFAVAAQLALPASAQLNVLGPSTLPR